MFLLLLCRRKNPEILNIVGRALLENCGIEDITYPAKGKREAIKTFRNALAIESLGWRQGTIGKSRLLSRLFSRLLVGLLSQLLSRLFSRLLVGLLSQSCTHKSRGPAMASMITAVSLSA